MSEEVNLTGELDTQREYRPGNGRKKRKKRAIIASLLIFVIVVVGISVGVTQNKKSDDRSKDQIQNIAPTIPFTPVATPSP